MPRQGQGNVIEKVVHIDIPDMDKCYLLINIQLLQTHIVTLLAFYGVTEVLTKKKDLELD